MARPREPIRRDVRLRRANAAAAVVLLAAGAAALACAALAQPWVGWDIPVDQARLDAAWQSIDLNTDSPASLRRLPEIGPERTAKIVAYRQDVATTRPFTQPADIMNVPSIKHTVFEQVEPYLR